MEILITIAVINQELRVHNLVETHFRKSGENPPSEAISSGYP